MSLDELNVGDQYSRHDIADRLGFKGHEALTAGVICPANAADILLFVNQDSRPDLHEYRNSFDGESLVIDGRTDHAYDNRLIASVTDGSPVRLFFREKRRGNFTYFGLMRLEEYELKQEHPSRFRFRALETRTDTGESGGPGHQASDDAFLGPEGKQRLATHVKYERDPNNRKAALNKHGRACVVCGFRFDRAYGPELARSYIEVHHTVSITKLGGRPPTVNELIPLCANCHRMAHRRPGEIVPIDELRAIYKSRSN